MASPEIKDGWVYQVLPPVDTVSDALFMVCDKETGGIVRASEVFLKEMPGADFKKYPLSVREKMPESIERLPHFDALVQLARNGLGLLFWVYIHHEGCAKLYRLGRTMISSRDKVIKDTPQEHVTETQYHGGVIFENTSHHLDINVHNYMDYGVVRAYE